MKDNEENTPSSLSGDKKEVRACNGKTDHNGRCNKCFQIAMINSDFCGILLSLKYNPVNMKRQIFTREQVISILEDALQRPDMLEDALYNEHTDFDAESILETCEAELISAQPKPESLKEGEEKKHPDAAKFADWILENRWHKNLQGAWERTFSYKEPEKATSIQLWEMFFNEVIKPKDEGTPKEQPDTQKPDFEKMADDFMNNVFDAPKYNSLKNTDEQFRFLYRANYRAGAERILKEHVEPLKFVEKNKEEADRLLKEQAAELNTLREENRRLYAEKMELFSELQKPCDQCGC